VVFVQSIDIVTHKKLMTSFKPYIIVKISTKCYDQGRYHIKS